MARRRRQDLSTLVRQAQEAAESVANAVDAGMPDATTSALSSLTSGLNEIERQVNQNGHAPAPAATSQAAGKQKEPVMAIEAEEQVLGAMMLARAAIKNASKDVRSDQFYLESHRLIFDAIMALDAREDDVTAVSVAGYLDQHGQLDNISGRDGGAGGKDRVYEIAGLALSSTNVATYARMVRKAALERNLDYATSMSPRDPGAVAEAAAALTREEVAGDARRAVDAADWLHAQPEGCPAVWGKGDAVLWAEGEPLMIYGPDGVGKTSLAQQVVLHICGIRQDVLLDLPIVRAERPVLYLACDRPRQARRSLYRMIPREKHEDLRDRLLVWEGPLPFVIPAQTKALLDFCQLHDAGYLVIDSLKDVAVELTNPEVALKVNQAFQWLNASGIELLVLHHPRKDPAGAPAKAKALADVYGDRNFVSGMGSVISLHGKGGDPIVELEHLKQPAGEVGPFKILHDHDLGVSTLFEHSTLIDILTDAERPLVVSEIACRFFGVVEAERNQMEKVRREMRKLVAERQVQEMQGEGGSLAFAPL